MLRISSLLKVARTCKNSLASCSTSSTLQQERSTSLGDQKAYYKVDLRKKLRKGNDTSFDVRDYEKDMGQIKGFGGWERPRVSGYSGRQRGGYGAGANLKPVNFFSSANLPPINRDYYSEHESVSQRSQAEIDEFLAKHEMTLEGTNVPRPIFSFDEANFDPKILKILKANFGAPTSIQAISWPVALSSRDLISIARTGSGKTLCFLLPGLAHTIHQSPRASDERNAPTMLVVLPTRELAQQVEQVARDYCYAMHLRLVCLFGGASKNVQAANLARGVDICVATPGRLLDFLEAGALSLTRCSYLVLDEADRMLDMGFEPQIRKVVSQIRPDRQTLMFSATWPKEIRALASDFQKEAVFLNIGSMELSANHNITQNIYVVDAEDKPSHLFNLLKKISSEPDFKALIFVETKRKADQITASLRRRGLEALCIHGDKSQSERDWVLQNFRNGSSKVLLATDVAARGLDVDDIRHVINYDYPNSSEDYVHRIGRTGRRDQKGTSHTFITPENANKAADLVKVLEEAGQIVPDELRRLISQHSETSAAQQNIKWRGFYGSVGRHAGGNYSKSGRPANLRAEGPTRRTGDYIKQKW